MSEKTPKKTSSGLLVISPAGFLLAHATNTKRWDLPKGGIDEGETPLQAALRETREEIGLDFESSASSIRDLGNHAYIPKKDLHLFLLTVDDAFSLKECKCSTYIERDNGTRFPETDAYAWIPEEKVSQYVSKGLYQYFQKLGYCQAPELTADIKPKPFVHKMK